MSDRRFVAADPPRELSAGRAGRQIAGVNPARTSIVPLISLALGILTATSAGAAPRFQTDQTILNDDGGWCWFQDERAIIVRNQLFVGSVASGHRDPERRGSVEVTAFDLRRGGAARFILRPEFELDDHAAPALVALRDGRILAMYTRHGSENRIYWRTTLNPADVSEWTPERSYVPSEASRVTYSNPCWLPGERGGRGRLYNFFRGYDDSFKPSWIYSDDRGESWQAGGLLIDLPEGTGRHRPYVKYASNGRDTIHFAFTEGHPRDFENGIYHAVLKRGVLRRVDGGVIRPLEEGPLLPGEAIQVQVGDPDHIAWIHDVALDRGGQRIRLGYSVRRGSAEIIPGQTGTHHRYYWAQWNGRAWWSYEIAFAGTPLYDAEEDYVGGICLHPDDPSKVFISTNVDPVSGAPLPSGHYEIFRGRRDSRGRWTWTSLTPDATDDNLRPVVPEWRSSRTVLLWLRGNYRTYTDYDLAVVLRVE